MAALTHVAVTVTGSGPVGVAGRNVLAYDLTTGAPVATCDLPDVQYYPQAILYRPAQDDFLVAGRGFTQGGTLHRLDRSLTLLASTELAVPPLPATNLWSLQSVRADFQGGLYVAYAAGTGTATGDQLLRQIDPVTFAPLHDWRTFLPPDARTFLSGDFALDGRRCFFAMRGGGGPNQHVIYQLTLATAGAAAFASYGSWSGGTNPTGQTYEALFLRPRADGTYVAATQHLSGTDGNTLNALLLLGATGTVTTAYPVAPTLPALTHLYPVSGLAVAGETAWFVTVNGRLARMDLTTGVETPIVETGLTGLQDLVVLEAPVPPTDPTRTLIRRLRRAPHLSAEQVTQFFARFQLDLEAGVGTATGPGVDPQVWLRWSDDGGHTWRGPLAVSAGTIGAFRRRAIWRRLGRSRDRVFEVSMSDPVKWALLAASLDAATGTS